MFIPWIENRYAEPFKMSDVSRHQREAVFQSRRRYLRVSYLNWATNKLLLCLQRTPPFCDGLSKWQNSASKFLEEILSIPSFEFGLSSPRRKNCDSFAQFTTTDHTQVQVNKILFREPSRYSWLGLGAD